MRYRVYRLLAGVVLMFLFWLVVNSIFGHSPAPVRGIKSYYFYVVLSILLVFSTVFLFFCGGYYVIVRAGYSGPSFKDGEMVRKIAAGF